MLAVLGSVNLTDVEQEPRTIRHLASARTASYTGLRSFSVGVPDALRISIERWQGVGIACALVAVVLLVSG